MKSYTTTKRNSCYEQQQSSLDPYSTNIVQRLLESDDDWKASEQIIKLTFKALCDIVFAQGQSIKDIKQVLTTRASKTELITGLGLKANITDITQTIQEISDKIDTQPSYSQLNTILKQYIHRSSMTEILAQKRAADELVIRKNQEDDKRIQMQQFVKTKIKQFQKQVDKKILNCVTLDEFQEALNIIDMKANSCDIKQTLQNTVSKQFLANCLQKKLNKSQLQTFMHTKADVNDLQYIVSSLQTKVNLTTLEKLTQVIQNKADKSDLVIAMQQQQLQQQKSNMSKSRKKRGDQQQQATAEITAQQLAALKSQLSHEINCFRQTFDNELHTVKNTCNELKRKLNDTHNEILQNLNLTTLDVNKSISIMKVETSEILDLMKNQIKNFSEQLCHKNNSETFMRQLSGQINLRKRCEQKIYEEIDALRRKGQETHNKVVENTQFGKFQNQVVSLIRQKLDQGQVQRMINIAFGQFTAKLQRDNQTNTLLLEKLQRTYSEAISANTSDILKLSKSICKKQDKYKYSMIEENIRKCRKQIEQCRKTVDKSYEQIQNKLTVGEYQNDLIGIKKKFDKMFKEIQTKANIKDVCVLVDSKASNVFVYQ